ncbi:HflC protein [hydrothermal vent metagenome]|uniref:HflC protein n=1 Tax=hydrothermal vent metagenome TaxID=652676 RepID=A0A3B0VRW1_9ZZZZ
MNNKLFIFLVLIILTVIGYKSFTFTVNERELALKLKIGKVVRADYETGLQWKIPGVHDIIKFDSRIQTLDNAPTSILNTDNEYLKVDYFVKWRILDVVKYYTTFNGNQLNAENQLSDVIKNALLEEFSHRTLQEVIATQRVEIMESLEKKAKPIAENFGMEVVDVRIKRINLSDEVSESVFNRMRSERAAEAAEHRSNGEKEAVNIRADTNKQVRIIVADATKTAALLKGEGDATATKEYAAAYNTNQELYSFLRSLEAYRNSFSNSDSMMVLDPKSDFFKHFNKK